MKERLTRSREDAEGKRENGITQRHGETEAQSVRRFFDHKGTKGTKKMECVRGREAAQWMGEWKWRE